MDAATLVPPPYVAGPLRLAPFRGWRLVPSRVGNPTTGRAFARPYKDVSARLVRWQARGLIEYDAEPALYLHEYSDSGITVRGLVGALDVSRRATQPEDRAVLPHEGIHPVQADELADRMAEMQLNPAPILLVHRGSPRLRRILDTVADGRPHHEFTDKGQQDHRIWAITDPAQLEDIATELADDRALIADGHHRYAAYLRLQRRNADSAPAPTDSGLAMLVDQEATPLFLGPIHRVLAGTSLDDLRDAADLVGIEHAQSDRDEAMAALSPDHIIATDGVAWAVLTLGGTGMPAVEVLHRELVPALAHGPTAVSYHHSVDDALHHGRRGAVALLMPALSVDQVVSVARADRLLPEKATSFQPKPALGVLIRSIAPEAASPS